MSTVDSFTEHADAARALIDGLLAGDTETVRNLYNGPADIDDPGHGRQIDGGFENLTKNWAPARLVKSTSSSVRHSTTGADGRFNATEISLELQKPTGNDSLDVVVVNEFNKDGGLLRTRLYYRLARITGLQNQRYRILPEQPAVHLEPFNPTLEAYQRALQAGDPDAMANTFSLDGEFNGHGQSQDLRDGVGMGFYQGRPAVLSVLKQMFDVGDKEAGYVGQEHVGTHLEKLNVFSDETTTVVEFNIIHMNHPVNRTSAGVAVYELGRDGLLLSARIYDEAW